MNIDKIIHLTTIAGKGLLGGLGIGAVAYGLFFLALTFNNQSELNIGTFVAVLSGLICVYISFNIKTKPMSEM